MIQNQHHNLCIAVMLCATIIPVCATLNYFDAPDALDTYADVSYEQEDSSVQKTHNSCHDTGLYYIRRATCAYILYELLFLYKEYTAPASYVSRFVPSLIKDTYAKYTYAAHVAFIFGKAYVYHAIATTAIDTFVWQKKELLEWNTAH